MNLLCFDIASGGISVALFDARLKQKKFAENKWVLQTGKGGEATLSVPAVLAHFKRAIHALRLERPGRIDAICIGTFMHNCLLLDEKDNWLSPVFTWLDRRGDKGLEYVRRRLKGRFHEITGCQYHPMFPVFKLAAIRQTDPEVFGRAKRVVSIKAVLIHQLTGVWVEDHG